MNRSSIYGYWIGKDEIHEVVNTWGHEDVAYDILEKKHGITSKTISEADVSIYDIMFRLGYVRVVNDYEESHKVQYWHETKLSKLQKQFVKEADADDDWNFTEYEFEKLNQVVQPA